MKMRIFFNPSPMDESIGDLPLESIDTFLVNENESRELKALAGGRIADCNVLTTFGADGAEYCGRDGEVIRIAAVKADNVVDTTGAGDTFTGYFIASLVQGKNPEEAMKTAAAASALAVSRHGAAESIPYMKELEN